MTESAWYLVLGGEERGPYPLQKLRDWAASGKLKRNIEVRPTGSSEVRLALAIPGLFPDSPSEEPATSEGPTFTVLDDDEPAESPGITVLEDDEEAEESSAVSVETDGVETPSSDTEPTAGEEDDGLALDSGPEKSPGESISILEEPEDTIPVAGDDEAPAEDDRSAAVGDPAVLSGAEKPAETLPVDEAAAAPKPEEPSPVIRQQAILSAAQKEKDAAAAVKVERKITGHSGPARPLRSDAAPMVVPNKPPATPADDIVVLADDDAADDLVVLEDDAADDLVVLEDEEPVDTLALTEDDGEATEDIRPDPALRDEPAPIAVTNDPPTAAADDDIVVEDDDEAAAAGPPPPPAEEESGDTFAFAEEESDQTGSVTRTGPPLPTFDYRTPAGPQSGALPSREIQRRRQPESTGSFFLKLPGAFVYPLTGWSLVFVVALAAMATLALFYGPLFAVRAMAAMEMIRPVIYSAAMVFLLVLVCIGAYLYRVGSASCQGDNRSPKLPNLGELANEIILPAFFLGTVLLVCELPYLIYAWRMIPTPPLSMAGPEGFMWLVAMKLLLIFVTAPFATMSALVSEPDLLLVSLHVLAWICFPLGLLCVMARGTLEGLDPRLWCRAFVAVPAQYLTTMLLCAAKGYVYLALLYYLAKFWTDTLVRFPMASAFAPGRSGAGKPFAEEPIGTMTQLSVMGLVFASVALALYLLVLQYRLIGLLYQTGRDKLHFLEEG